MLTAQQTLAVRRAYPEAHVDGQVIRIGRWMMNSRDVRLDLPMSEGPTGWYTDGCDEAMTVWAHLCELLRC